MRRDGRERTLPCVRLLPVLIVCALLLTGCGQGPAAPSDPVPSGDGPSVDAGRVLANGFWRVEGADEPASTRVRFGTASVTVFRAGGAVYGELATRGDRLLTSFDGWSMSLGDDHEVPWLEAAATVERADGGVRLLGVDGAPVAGLVRADAPPSSSAYETDPTPFDPPASPEVVPPSPTTDVTAAAIAGTWRLPGRSDAALVLAADGDWRAVTSCASGTGAAGGAGRFRVLDGGVLLVTAGPVAAVGCAEPVAPPPAGARAIARFDRAGSVVLDGDRLTVHDRAGAALGTLVR